MGAVAGTRYRGGERHGGNAPAGETLPPDGALRAGLLEISPVPITVLDADKRVVLANERAKRALGLPESTGIDTGERVLEVFPGLPVVVLTGLSNREVAVERRAREQQLELRTERLETFGKFASVISHELRNPLNIAKGYTTLVDKLLQLSPVSTADPVDLIDIGRTVDRSWTQLPTDGATLRRPDGLDRRRHAN